MLHLKNATLYDGSGNAPISGDVLLDGGRILATGHMTSPADARAIDLQGLALAPGFIDMHSHSDLKVLENRREKIEQGITAEVVGNCGFSAFPCGGHADQIATTNEGILNGRDSFHGAAEYLTAARTQSHLVHVESLVGHGTLRTAVYGERAATQDMDRLDEMLAQLDEALAEGAVGLSSGLMYAPGSEAPFAELEALCRVVARYNKLYTTHMRSYSWTLLESLDEQIELARRTGCRLQISHLQAVGRDNWDKQQQAFDRIEQAAAEGIDIAFDCYPYLAGSTVLSQLLPQHFLANGIAGLKLSIQDRAQRATVEKALHEETAQAWSDIFLSSVQTAANKPLVGQHFAAIAEARSTSPEAAVLDILVEEDGRANIVAFNQCESNLRALLTHPRASIITDGFYVAERPHPRLAGAFPTLLGDYVRQRGWLSTAQAIRKVTHEPAKRLGITDRGNLLPGSRADLCIFSPEAVGTDATFERPESSPRGIALVLQGGKPVAGSSSILDNAAFLPA